MRLEAGERELYNQLLYWRGLWDVDGEAGVKGAAASAVVKKENEVNTSVGGAVPGGVEQGGDEKESVRAQAEFNRERFGVVKGVVEGYLRMCGRVWVQMDEIFGFALQKAG